MFILNSVKGKNKIYMYFKAFSLFSKIYMRILSKTKKLETSSKCFTI